MSAPEIEFVATAALLGFDAHRLATTRDYDEQLFMISTVRKAAELYVSADEASAVRIANAVGKLLN